MFIFHLYRRHVWNEKCQIEHMYVYVIQLSVSTPYQSIHVWVVSTWCI